MRKNISKLILISFMIFINAKCLSQEIATNIINDSLNLNKSIKLDLLKIKLTLNDNQINRIKNNDSITNELFLSIKDTSKIRNVKRRLDSFYSGKYNTKKLLIALQLERLLKSGSFEFDDKLDPNKAIHFEKVDDFINHKKEFENNLIKNSQINKSKDSTKQKKKQ